VRRVAADRSRSLWGAVGAALVLLGVGAFVLSNSFDTPQSAKVLPPVVPVNSGATDAADISAHNSPTIARNPLNGRQLVVVNRIDTPGYSCAVNVSSDGGASWTQTAVPAPKGQTTCYAPDAAFGADGTLYMSFVTLRPPSNVPTGAWLVRSKDGGRTLSAPVRVLGPLVFQVRLATDPREPRRVYLSWLRAPQVGVWRFARTGNPILTMRSDDRGATWQRPVPASSSDRIRAVAPSPAVGPDGELYVLYLDLGDDRLDYDGGHEGRGGPPYSGRWKLVLATSQDRGATWSESVVDGGIVPTERIIAFIPPFPSLAVESDSGRVYAAFHDGRLGDADVWVWSLEKGAKAWEGPTRVNDTRERDGTSQYLPKLAVSPGARLDVVYYDRRADPRNVMNGVSLQFSSDHGESFSKSIRLSDKTFSSRIGFGRQRNLPDLGSRLGLVSTDSRAIAVWTDTRAGTPASNKQDLAQAVVAFSDPARLSKPVEYLLRFGGLGLALVGMVVLAGGLAYGAPTRR
jgi:hypothetical protein